MRVGNNMCCGYQTTGEGISVGKTGFNPPHELTRRSFE